MNSTTISALHEGTIKAGFRDEMIILPLDKILPTRVVSADQRKNLKFQTIATSIKKVGIIEPPVVTQQGKNSGHYILLDGHIRIEILKEMGAKDVCCLISTDDESYTYNKYVSRLSPIQEHTMILKAVDRGLSEEAMAEALNVNIADIRRKRNLLTGICPNAVNILKDQMVSAGVFPILRQMKDTRQFEAAVLMNDANLYITSFARSLLIATPRDMLVNPDKSYKTKKYSPEQIANLEGERERVERQYQIISETYDADVFNLILAQSWIGNLMKNERIKKYLTHKHPDVFTQFQYIIGMKSLTPKETI